MQGLWYGDRRDRVKWGALAHLVDRFKLASILQVAYFRDGVARLLKTDLGECPIADDVWKHFADLAAIERLSEALGVEVRVYGKLFDPRKREDYVEGVLSAAGQGSRPRLLFLDPDTGIEPGTLKPEHASSREIARLWSSLDHGEVLAVYQHAPHETAWVEKSVERMAKACQGATVLSIQGTVAADVAILWARKDR
jgi:hypothetical protein